MYLTKTIQTIREFDAAIQAAKQEFQAAKSQILATYKDPTATEKLAEAREVLTAFEAKETVKAREVVTADFEQVRNAVESYVSVSVPDDFTANIVAIQAKGSITDFEAASLLKKYRDNYTAFSAALDVLKRHGKAKDVHVIKPDIMDEKITAIEKRLLNWIQNRAGVGGFDTEYYSLLFTKETGSPIQDLADEVAAYLAGGFIHDNSGQGIAYKVD